MPFDSSQNAICWKCGGDAGAPREIFRDSVCAVCGADLRCCRGCEFYSPGSRGDCRESIDESVSDKERANFCGYFSPRKSFAPAAVGAKAASARRAFDALFKEAGEP